MLRKCTKYDTFEYSEASIFRIKMTEKESVAKNKKWGVTNERKKRRIK